MSDETADLPEELPDDEAYPYGDQPQEGPYVEVTWPTERFVIMHADENYEGPYEPDDMVRDEETGAYAFNVGNSPRFIRAILQQDDVVYWLDGGGRPWRSRLILASTIGT